MRRIKKTSIGVGQGLGILWIVGVVGVVGCGSGERGGVEREDLDMGGVEAFVNGGEAGVGKEERVVVVPENLSFNTHVQPILSEYCYQCHGFDSSTRFPEENPLRLDSAEFAFEPRGDGEPVIIAGDPDASKLVRRMESDVADFKMPPPEAHKEVSQAEIEIIKAWIAQGAEYQEHWAFLAPERVEPGEVSVELEAWVKNPIDRYVAVKMEEQGMEPNPVEEPHRFLRRLSFDLTGLPPTSEEIMEFERQWEEDADVAVLAAAERLMAGSAYAEHMARHWLDAVRYGDTHGIHIDNYRAIWPYRDWVIAAFGENKRWDEFTIEQIAGDLLPDADLDQIVATGYGRSMPTTGEGGAIAEEYNAIYAQDRTDTTAAVWLGLTTNCAACHDHKFDPVTQKDVYAFNAFFNNTTMNAMDGNNAEHPPNIFVPRRGDRERLQELEAERGEIERRFNGRMESFGGEFAAWTEKAREQPMDVSDADLLVHLPLNESEGAIGGVIAGVDVSIGEPEARHVDELGSALVLGGGNAVEVGDIPVLERADVFSYGAYIYIEDQANGAVVARMDPGNGFRGWDIWMDGRRPAAHVIDRWPDKATKITAREELAAKEWHHVLVTFDGSKPAAETMRLYVNGHEAEVNRSHDTVGEAIHADVPLRLGAREPEGESRNALNGRVLLRDFRLYGRLLSGDEISRFAEGGALRELLAVEPGERTVEQEAVLRRHYASHVDEEGMELLKQIEAKEMEMERVRGRGSVSLIMEEKRDSEPSAHVLIRGDYATPGDRVLADTPAVLPPMPEDAPRNRIGLAQWLVSPENPLPARVTVNRTWYYFFGRGIVETTEDFGIMGGRPSHPELLDWLALEFVGSGWDYQALLKQIVTSATYRQSGMVPADKLERDPDNLFLARGPRYRLDAEQIRDAALAASGLLVDEVGGPSVRPYQPEGIWEAVAMPQSNTKNYQQDSGSGLYRRSMYTFWKRTAPPASMETFDAPTRELFCVRRDRTNTPLQALVVMNDPQFVEASRVLAERVLLEGGSSTSERLDFIALRLIARALEEGERVVLEQTLEAALAVFGDEPEEAGKLVVVGESRPGTEVSVVDLAAWTLVVNQMMNLDEALTK